MTKNTLHIANETPSQAA